MTPTEEAEFIDPGADGFDEGQEEAVASAGNKTDDKPGDKPGDKAGDKNKDDRAELNSLRARVTAAEEATRYWHEQARGAAAPQPKAEEAPDKPLSVDLVDAISSGDKKAIKTAMSELGFVDRATMDAHVAAARQQGVTEAELLRQYPELSNNESEFFKTTQKQFARLVSRGMDPKSLATTQTAAEFAAQSVEGRESGRGDRIRRQAGDRGARPSSRGRDGASDELDNQQKSIIDRFRAVGAPVTEEGYKKRAASGVSMGGVRTRRAA